MYLKKNIELLKNIFQYIPWDNFINFNERDMPEVKIKSAESKSGLPTLTFEASGSSVYIHSKYDPESEAKKVAEQYEDNIKENDVVFFGVGLGYHIEEFIKLNPKIKCSIYEPMPEIFYQFLCERDLSRFPVASLHSIFIDEFFPNSDYVKYAFMKSMNYSYTIVTLPSYERVFPQKYKAFVKDMTESLKDKRVDIMTKYIKTRDWNRNSILNLSETINSKNFLHIDKNIFAGKPAIIVSSGPSLQDEVQNLKYIKENGLAYIFSAGSAIQSMLELGIQPDAAFAFDSSPANVKFFEKITAGEVKDIPLVFGTLLYNDVVKNYKGEKYHFVLGEDIISQYYLELNSKEELITLDAVPSIAIILLRILNIMKFSPIILVGQNLAYRDNLYYSKGIVSEGQSSIISEEAKAKAFLVEDVYGGKVYTEESLDIMRRQMSLIIGLSNITNVINTSKGGAKIEGTTFETMDSVINSRLNGRVVEKDWRKVSVDGYNKAHMKEKCQELALECEEVNNIIYDIEKIIRRLAGVDYSRTNNYVSRLFSKLSESFGNLVRNKYYEIYLIQLTGVQHELINRELQELSQEQNLVIRAHICAEKFSAFIKKLKNEFEYITPYFNDMNKNLLEMYGEEK